jgi:hypothetical protein
VNIQIAIIILINAGYLVKLGVESDNLIVSLPNRSVTVEELIPHLEPFNPDFIRFEKVNEAVRIYFD